MVVDLSGVLVIMVIMKANIIRNKELVELRDKDPEKYSFGKLGKIFRITAATAHEIYHREKIKNSKGKRKIPLFLVKKYPTL